MADLDAVQAAVEQACAQFQNPATQAQAEQVLLHFRQHHRPALPACRHILTTSQSADARFQAALVLREALLREWASMSEPDRDALQAWLLQEVVQLSVRAAATADSSAAGGAGGAHVATLVGTLAVAVKRGWMDKPPERRAALLQEAVNLVASCGGGAGGAPAAAAALRVLEAVVVEFNLGSATPLGLPWDFHQRCCRDLEDHHLQRLFSVAAGLAQQAAASGAALRGEDAGVTPAAISLMTACLQWEFRRAGLPAHANLSVPLAKQRAADAPGALPSGSNSTGAPLTPGQSWSELLLSPATTQWLPALMQQLRAAYGPLHPGSARGAAAGSALAGLPAAQRAAVVSTAVKSRGLLLALCSLSGDVFPKQDAGGVLRAQYLAVLLQGVLPMFWPVQGALQAAAACGFECSELLDACRCICALAPIHRAGPLQAAGTHVLSTLHPELLTAPHSTSAANHHHAAPPPPLPGASAGGFLGVVELVTLCMVHVGGVNASGASCADEGDDRYWQQECLDMLLEAWSVLLVNDSLASTSSRPDGSHLPPGATAAAAAVFRGVVDAALADAARGAHEDLEDALEAAGQASLDDWMARCAALARHAPTATLPHLVAGLLAAQHALAAAAASRGDAAVPLEQLSWLSRLAAHCLADSGLGETPLVPLALCMALEAGVPGAAEAVLQLCGALLGLPALVLSPQARPALSPRLMENCVWALARWADTYLFPEEDLPAPLKQAYGDPAASSNGGDGAAAAGAPQPHQPGSGEGLAVLDMAVQVANACLTSFPGEGELHKQVVGVLLPVLVRRRPLCERLMRVAAWQALTEAVAGRVAGLQEALSHKLHRGLMQCLCMAAAGIHRTSAATQYVHQLLSKTVAEVVALASRPDLGAVASRADAVVGVCCLLESLRGATRGTLSRTQPALFQLTGQLLQPLLTLQAAFKAHTQVVALVLKLASEVVEEHVSYLKPPEVEALMRWVLALLQQYASINTWAVRLTASRAQQEAAHVEAARDLRALLRLLSHVTQRDLALDSHGGGGGGGRGGGADVTAATAANAQAQQLSLDTAQVVLTGLNILLPLMSTELLKFPKLPRLYFNLLAYMMESYPQQVAALAPAQFHMLLSTLEFGLSDHVTDGVVMQSALEGLAGLARYQQQCQATGQLGLAAHALPAAEGAAGGAAGRTVTSHFLELLLKRLLLGDWAQDMVELAGDALQPLMAIEQGTYAGIAQQLVAAHLHDASASQRIGAALAGLLHPEQVVAQASLAGGGTPPQAAVPQAAAGRHQRRVFRQALCHVVADVRSLVRTR